MAHGPPFGNPGVPPFDCLRYEIQFVDILQVLFPKRGLPVKHAFS